MKVIVHRGTHQIGGCITEIKTDQARIFIDMGDELPKEGITSIPIDIDGVTKGVSSCDGVFFTHYHGDHIGMFSRIFEDIPLYMGEAAKEIFLVLQEHMSHRSTDIRNQISRIENILTFQPAKPIYVKDIKITPYMVDHSAYDSYMFLIEGDGKRILHTGDFRTHGFRGKGLSTVLEKYIGTVDLLITEGTSLSRKCDDVITEKELSQKAKTYFKKYNYIFVLCASTNVDRIAAVYSATPRGKYFICDNYQKDVLEIVKKYGAKKSELYAFEKVRTYGDNLLPKLKEQGFCMLIRNNEQFRKIMSKFDSDKSIVLYSMWQGYLEYESMKLLDFLKGYHWEYFHTSGHATTTAIESVCNAVSPKLGIITIHSDAPDQLKHKNIPYPILDLKDREEFEI